MVAFLPSASFKTPSHQDGETYRHAVELVVSLLESGNWRGILYQDHPAQRPQLGLKELSAEFDDKAALDLEEMLTASGCSFEQTDDLMSQVVEAMQKLGRSVSPTLSNWGRMLRRQPRQFEPGSSDRLVEPGGTIRTPQPELGHPRDPHVN